MFRSNVGSTASYQSGEHKVHYCASKAAVGSLTKGLALELGRHGIRVNSIHPGYIETAMLHQVPGVDAGRIEEMLRRVPLHRVGGADEVAKLALFLASDDSSYSTGCEFVIDGGMTA